MSIIKEIKLHDTGNNGLPNPVRIEFKDSTTWIYLTIPEILKILKLFIIGEEKHYPPPQCKGRWLLFKEILKVFLETK